jgi:hypothetical protein
VETQNSGAVTVHARFNIHISVPAERVAAMLKDTNWEGRNMTNLDDSDRQGLGELLDERMAEDFPDLLHYAGDDAEAEVDW